MALLNDNDFEGTTYFDKLTIPTVNAEYWASREPPGHDRPVYLWDTAFGTTKLLIFDKKTTGLSS